MKTTQKISIIIVFALLCSTVCPQVYAQSETGSFPYTEGKVYSDVLIPALPGDINGDMQITAEDARLALRYTARLEKPYLSGYAKGLYDFNADGTENAADARFLLRVSAKLDIMPLKMTRSVPWAYDYILEFTPEVFYTGKGVFTHELEFNSEYLELYDDTTPVRYCNGSAIRAVKAGTYDILYKVMLDGEVFSAQIWSVTFEKDLDDF